MDAPVLSKTQVTEDDVSSHRQDTPFMADGFDDATAGGLVAACQFLKVCSSDCGQQGLGEVCLKLAPHHKVLILEMPHILIPQVLQVESNCNRQYCP